MESSKTPVSARKKCIVGIDTGGTFTDFVWSCDGKLNAFKVLSTPADPALAILDGLRQLEQMGVRVESIVHGTTVATNALLEGKGVATAYIGNEGLQDILLIGRQSRSDIYALCPQPLRAALKREYCIGVPVRVDAQGEIIRDLQSEDMDALRQHLESLGVQAVAVCLLFSFFNNTHERALRDFLSPSWYCSISSEVAPEIKEFERGITTWLNSYLGPEIHNYLHRLEREGGVTNIQVMQSSGLTLALDEAADRSVRLLLSGPAGGYIAAQRITQNIDLGPVISLDMGGTSTDVAMIEAQVHLTTCHTIAGYPVSIPALDIHTIGAGGGSVAWLDEGGVLQVGPRSAGANPGPAAYGLGGCEPTVTDANIVLGRIPVEHMTFGKLELSREKASQAIQVLAQQMGLSVVEVAIGIVGMANEQMLEALRVISVLRGRDPRNCSLMCFGGAGALHVCELAQALGITRILFPTNAGQLSALGMLMASPGEEASLSLCKTVSSCSDEEIEDCLLRLAQPVACRLGSTDEEVLQYEKRVDMRYQGQSTCLTLPWHGLDKTLELFEQEYTYQHGSFFADLPVELVAVRVKVYHAACLSQLPRWQKTYVGEAIGTALDACTKSNMQVYRRTDLGCEQSFTGPCIVLDKGSTLYVHRHWRAQVDQWGHIRLFFDLPSRYNSEHL